MAVEIKDLLQKATAGEQKAVNALISQATPVVWGVLKKFHSLSHTEREDLAQDVFVALLSTGFQSFRGSTEHELRWYVKTITENEAKSYLRKRGHRSEDPLPEEYQDEPFSWPDPQPGPEEMAAVQEVREKLRRCLQELSSTDQEIFWMRERGRLYQEISKVLGIPLGTLGVKYDRAKTKIGECLRKAGIFGQSSKNKPSSGV